MFRKKLRREGEIEQLFVDRIRDDPLGPHLTSTMEMLRQKAVHGAPELLTDTVVVHIPKQQIL